MKKALIVFCAAVSLCWMSGNAAAMLINSGFETGDLTGWETIGDISIQMADFGTGATEGNFQAVLTNDVLAYWDGEVPGNLVYPLSGNPAAVGGFEAFFGLPSNYLYTITEPPHLFEPGDAYVSNGSGIKQTFYGKGGDILTFDWNYLTNDGYNYDYSFVSVVSLDLLFVQKLAGNVTFELIPPGGEPLFSSNTIFSRETGFQTFSLVLPQPGFYSLGVGVLGVRDDIYDSGLIIDNVKITPVAEPSSLILLGSGLVGLMSFRKRFMK